MALSDWDIAILAFNGGEKIIEREKKPTAYVRKNWIYIEDEKAWTKGGRYVSPVIAHINEGDVIYHDLNILAWRGPKDGIYSVIYTEDLDKQGQERYSGYISIGVYGWDIKTPENHEPSFVGIEQSDIDFFMEMIIKSKLDEDLKRLIIQKKDDIKRVNQGDAYIASSTGGDAEITKAGEASTPLLISAIKSWEKPKSQPINDIDKAIEENLAQIKDVQDQMNEHFRVDYEVAEHLAILGHKITLLYQKDSELRELKRKS